MKFFWKKCLKMIMELYNRMFQHVKHFGGNYLKSENFIKNIIDWITINVKYNFLPLRNSCELNSGVI